MKYMLISFVQRVEGINGCLLINHDTSKVLDLGKDEALVLSSILSGVANEQQFEKFLNLLLSEKWIVKVKDSSLIEKRASFHPFNGFALKKAILELTTNCYLDCLYCDRNSDFPVSACTCKRWSYDKIKFDYSTIVTQLLSLGVEKIMIIGGDPFFDANAELLSLLNALRKHDYLGELVIFTNGSMIRNEHISMLQIVPNTRINFILLGSNEDEYDYISQKPNVYGTIIENVKMVKKNNILVHGTYLLNNYNTSNLSTSSLNNLGIHIGSKFIFHERLTNVDLLKAYESRQNTIDFVYNQIVEQINQCLYQQIFISSDLKVYPCPYLRDFCLGDLKMLKIHEVFMKDKYREFWLLSKSLIENCQKCKYRITCADCRALEYGATKNLYGEYYCSLV